MKKRKVLISALLAAAVVSTAALTSCGDKNDDNKKTTTSADAGTTTQGDVTTTSEQGGTTTTQGDVTTTTQGDVTTTTQGDVTTTTSEQGGTTTTEEVIDNKATLELHYNGADLDEVSDSIEIELTEDDGDGVKYAEIPSDKLTVRDTYREFKGWFTNKELTIPATADQLQYIEEDTTLYAKWEAVGSMTTFEVNATSDLGAGTLANDYKKGIYTVKSGSTIRSASPTGEYSTGYTQEIQGNGNMQIYISPLENTTLSVIYCQRSTGSVSSAELFEVVDGVVSDTSIAQIYCSTDGTKTGTKLASNATGKKDIEVEGGKTYLLKGTGGTCSVLDITCQYEVTPSPVDSVEVITAKSIDLIEGESFDSAAVGVKRNFENGTSEDLSTGFTIDASELDLTQEGVYTVTVNYAPEEYIYGKLKGTTYTDEITINVYSIKELILGFNQTVKENGTYNGTYVNHTVKTIYKAGEQYSADSLSATAYATIGEGANLKEYYKLLTAADYDIDLAGEAVSESCEVTVTYTTNDKDTEAKYNIYVVGALDVTQSAYKVKVDDDLSDSAIGTVASGAYQFKTINQAMNFLRLYKDTANYEEKTIELTIAAGYYAEKVEFDLPNMTVKGAGRVNKALDAGFDWTEDEITSKTIIEWNSINGKPDESGYTQQTDSSATVAVRETAENFYISGVTISNDFNSFQDFVNYYGDRPNQSQALALLVQADKFVMNGCDLHGYQDTLETFTGRQVFIDTLISGTTDFIFGTNNSTYFYNCEIRCISPAQVKDGYIQYNVDGGYVTAPKGNNKGAEDAIEWGIVFDGCTFSAEKYIRNIDGYTAQIKLADKSYAEYEVAAGGLYYTRVDQTKVTAPVAGTTYYTFTVENGVATFAPAGEITAWAENTEYATAETITTGNTAIGRPWGTYASVSVINSTLGGHISLLDYDYTYTAVAADKVKTKDVLTAEYAFFSKVDTATTTTPASGTTYYTLVEGVFTVAEVTAWEAGTDYYIKAGTKKVGNDYKTESDNVYHATAIASTTSFTYVANPDKKAVTNAVYYTSNGVEIAQKSDYDAATTYYERKDPSDQKNRRYVMMSGNSPMLDTISYTEYNNTGSGAGTIISADATRAYSVLASTTAPNQDKMFGLHNGEVTYDGTWRGVTLKAGAAYGKVIEKNANLILNLVGDNTTYYADANVTSAFTTNTQYYVYENDAFKAIDVNVYSFKAGTNYYYDKTVYVEETGSISTKAKLSKAYDYFEKVDKTKVTTPVEGTTYYTLSSNVFAVAEVTEWDAATDYYVNSGKQRKAGEDASKSGVFLVEAIAESTSFTYVTDPESYLVTNKDYYEQDGTLIAKGTNYDETKKYYNKGTQKALVEDTSKPADKTIKYYSVDDPASQAPSYSELAFNSTNFDVSLETPEEDVTYYVASNKITWNKVFYNGIAISEEEFYMLYDAYKATNPSLADWSILGVYADADMTTPYAYGNLGLNNNNVYVQLGVDSIIDTYSYSGAKTATNSGWTLAEAGSDKGISPTTNSTVHKSSEATGSDVLCISIKTSTENSYVQSPTFAAGTKALNVTIFGGTNETNDARFKVVAYNAAGTKLTEVKALKIETAGAKNATHFYTDDAVKDSKGNYTIPVTATEDIAYIRIIGTGKTGDTLADKANGIYSIDVEAIYDTDGIIFKNYVGDIEFPATAKPWKLADGTMSDTVQGTTATFADGLITADASVSGAKIYSRASSWAQFNTGAKISFKVKPGATVTFNVYNANAAQYSINGGTAVVIDKAQQAVSFTVDHLSTITIEATANTYIADFTVTF